MVLFFYYEKEKHLKTPHTITMTYSAIRKTIRTYSHFSQWRRRQMVLTKSQQKYLESILNNFNIILDILYCTVCHHTVPHYGAFIFASLCTKKVTFFFAVNVVMLELTSYDCTGSLIVKSCESLLLTLQIAKCQ
jgi:GTP cyclohydrolase I